MVSQHVYEGASGVLLRREGPTLLAREKAFKMQRHDTPINSIFILYVISGICSFQGGARVTPLSV